MKPRDEQRGEVSVSGRRHGLSLVEIIVAIGVLGGAAVILGQMLDVGVRHAERAEEVAEAQVVAHNLMAEFVLGERPWQVVERPQPVSMFSPWDFSVEMTPVGVGGLQSVTISVFRRAGVSLHATPTDAIGPSVEKSFTSDNDTGPDANRVSQTESSLDRPAKYHLTRWIHREAAQSDSLFDDGSTDEIVPRAVSGMSP